MPRNFVGEPFSVSLFSAAEKVWIREGVKYHDFLSKIICLTVRINSVGGANPLAFHSFRASIKFGQVGGGGGSVQNFLSHSTETIRKGTP